MDLKIDYLKNIYKRYGNVVITVCALLVFFLLTFFSHQMQNFNKDEIHAWNIASYLNFFEIIKLMRVEGHTFIWYTLLKPFTLRPDIFYPWIIKYLNWFFVFGAVLILWICAPLKKIYKILITFSQPFLYIAILGRCYGIGLFLITLIIALYKKRFQKPFIFALLLFLAANTSLMAGLFVFGISIVFLYDLFKFDISKKILPIITIVLIPVSLYIQWHNPVIPGYTLAESSLLSVFKYHLLNEYRYVFKPIVPLIVYLSGILISYRYFRYNKRILFYLSSAFFIFTVFAIFVYNFFNYHYGFMFLLFCFYYWLYIDSGSCAEVDKKALIIFNIWLICFFFLYMPFIKESGEWFTKKSRLASRLKCIDFVIPDRSIIYTSMFSIGLELPDLNEHYILKDLHGKNLVSFNSFYYTYNPFYINNYDDIKKIVQLKNRTNMGRYLIIDKRFVNGIFPDAKDFGYPFICPNLYIYDLNDKNKFDPPNDYFF